MCPAATSIRVNVTNASDLYGYEFDLSYDPTVLQFSSEAEGGFLSVAGATFFIPGKVDPVAGTIAFNEDSLLSPPCNLGEWFAGSVRFHGAQTRYQLFDNLE